MNHAITLLSHAFVDSFRPQMLLLTLASVALAGVFWIVLIWFSIDPLAQLAINLLTNAGFDIAVPAGQDFLILSWLKAILVPLAVFGFLLPIVASSAVLLAGLYVTPPVVKYLIKKEFVRIQAKSEASLLLGFWVTFKAVFVFLMAWFITLPLWLIPSMAFVLPVVLTAWLLMTVMRFDALSEHATKIEMKQLQKRHSGSA